MKKVTKYRAIQIALRMEGYGREDVARCLGRSVDYVSKHFRLNDGMSFDLDEAYAILDLVGIPKEQIFVYFPPGGVEVSAGLKLKERREMVI